MVGDLFLETSGGAMKKLTLALSGAARLALAGSQTGYWRLNEAPRQNTNWAAITDVVGQQLKK